MSTIFSQQIIGGKLLLVLNCAFKKQTKSQLKKIVSETINYGSPHFTKPKKKTRNITKCYNIFKIPLFSIVVNFGLIYYYLFYRNVIFVIFS